MKLLKTFSFGLTGLLVVVMIVATVLEKQYGTSFVSNYIYGSTGFACGWAAVALSAMTYILLRVPGRVTVWLLHGSFALILAGALVTHIWGQQGKVYLRQDVGTPVGTFVTGDGEIHPFPFQLSLKEFTLEYYPGTSAPMDFISRILVSEGNKQQEGQVSMNRIFRYRNYRFYQQGYDADGRGSTLSVAYDPYGIGLTYCGYASLLVSFILFFFDSKGGFRRLLRHPLLRGGLASVMLLCGILPAVAADKGAVPRALPRETAAVFGDLLVYYNDRICPLQTLAKDFTVKLYGRASYKGLTPEQVLTGWFFYYDDWKETPFIHIKSREVGRLLGIEGNYVRLTDFAGREGYKLDEAVLANASVKEIRAFEEANEKFSLVSMAAAGSLWKLFPYKAAGDTLAGAGERLTWLSLADRLPAAMPHDERVFVRNCMSYVSEQVARKNFGEVRTLVAKIRKYQVRAAGKSAPGALPLAAEKIYNRLNNSLPTAIASVLLGILAFVYCIRRLIKGRRGHTPVTRFLLVLMAVELLFLCGLIVLRGLVSGHVPMSNGHETMQLLAATSLLLTFFISRRLPVAVAFGFLVCGLALMVSMMGESNPQVTQLMPVLSSPLLSIHVAVIMLAYALLAFVMFNGVTGLILHASRRDCAVEVERLQVISRLILYPAVFLLAIGIFVGAVWANISWGRYWGWDPKEVWALITLLVYALALHPASLPRFRRPVFFHVFAIVAFLSVLITYFGVNFLLGGMHSYA